MKKRLDIHEGVVVTIVVVTLILLFVPGQEPSSFVIALLSVASFLFGIFVAFSTADRHKRLSEIRTMLREGDARILDLYNLSKLFGKKARDDVRKLLDSWVVAQLDYYLPDYYRSAKSFPPIYDYVVSLKPKTSRQNAAYDDMLATVEEMNKEIKTMQYLVNDRISKSEWLNILVLGGIMMFCLIYINTGSLFSMFVVVLLAVALSTIILVLRDLDQLIWKEHVWIWEPLTNLFEEMDLLPYYPDEILERQRFKVAKGKKYRYAIYPHPYPDITEKKVEIRTG